MDLGEKHSTIESSMSTLDHPPTIPSVKIKVSSKQIQQSYTQRKTTTTTTRTRNLPPMITDRSIDNLVTVIESSKSMVVKKKESNVFGKISKSIVGPSLIYNTTNGGEPPKRKTTLNRLSGSQDGLRNIGLFLPKI